VIRCAYCQLPILPGQSYRMLAVDGPWPEGYRNIHLHTPECAEKWEEEQCKKLARAIGATSSMSGVPSTISKLRMAAYQYSLSFAAPSAF